MSSVTTDKARDLFADAHYQGVAVPQVVEMGWGDGGVDGGGNVITPSGSLTTVPGEFIRTAFTGVVKDGLTVTFTSEIIYTDPDALGKDLSSCGIYDDLGNLIAVKNFKAKNIDDETRIEVDWRELF